MPEAFAVYKNRLTWGSKLCAWLREGKAERGGREGGEVDGKREREKEREQQCPFDTKREESGTCPFA